MSQLERQAPAIFSDTYMQQHGSTQYVCQQGESQGMTTPHQSSSSSFALTACFDMSGVLVNADTWQCRLSYHSPAKHLLTRGSRQDRLVLLYVCSLLLCVLVPAARSVPCMHEAS